MEKILILILLCLVSVYTDDDIMDDLYSPTPKDIDGDGNISTSETARAAFVDSCAKRQSSSNWGKDLTLREFTQIVEMGNQAQENDKNRFYSENEDTNHSSIGEPGFSSPRNRSPRKDIEEEIKQRAQELMNNILDEAVTLLDPSAIEGKSTEEKRNDIIRQTYEDLLASQKYSSLKNQYREECQKLYDEYINNDSKPFSNEEIEIIEHNIKTVMANRIKVGTIIKLITGTKSGDIRPLRSMPNLSIVEDEYKEKLFVMLKNRANEELKENELRVIDNNNFDKEIIEAIENQITEEGFRQGKIKPIILDLKGDGISLTFLTNSKIHFPMDETGKKHLTSWVGSDDGILVWDKNKDGNITFDELSFSQYAENREATDIEGLRALVNKNRDQFFNKKDSFFTKMQVWQDLNQDGKSQKNELKSLKVHGIQAIGLKTYKTQTDRSTKPFQYSFYIRKDGSCHPVLDASLIFQKTANSIYIKSDGKLFIYWGSTEGDVYKASGEENMIYGYSGNDFVSGANGRDIIHGGADDDKVYGFGGNDKLFGGPGNDVIQGDKGDDYIEGGPGYDVLSGGIGADIFKHNISEQSEDEIRDFKPKLGDRLNIDHTNKLFSMVETVKAINTQTINDAGDVTLTFHNKNRVILKGFSKRFEWSMTTHPAIEINIEKSDSHLTARIDHPFPKDEKRNRTPLWIDNKVSYTSGTYTQRWRVSSPAKIVIKPGKRTFTISNIPKKIILNPRTPIPFNKRPFITDDSALFAAPPYNKKTRFSMSFQIFHPHCSAPNPKNLYIHMRYQIENGWSSWVKKTVNPSQITTKYLGNSTSYYETSVVQETNFPDIPFGALVKFQPSFSKNSSNEPLKRKEQIKNGYIIKDFKMPKVEGVLFTVLKNTQLPSKTVIVDQPIEHKPDLLNTYQGDISNRLIDIELAFGIPNKIKFKESIQERCEVFVVPNKKYKNILDTHILFPVFYWPNLTFSTELSVLNTTNVNVETVHPKWRKFMKSYVMFSPQTWGGGVTSRPKKSWSRLTRTRFLCEPYNDNPKRTYNAEHTIHVPNKAFKIVTSNYITIPLKPKVISRQKVESVSISGTYRPEVRVAEDLNHDNRPDVFYNKKLNIITFVLSRSDNEPAKEAASVKNDLAFNAFYDKCVTADFDGDGSYETILAQDDRLYLITEQQVLASKTYNLSELPSLRLPLNLSKTEAKNFIAKIRVLYPESALQFPKLRIKHKFMYFIPNSYTNKDWQPSKWKFINEHCFREKAEWTIATSNLKTLSYMKLSGEKGFETLFSLR